MKKFFTSDVLIIDGEMSAEFAKKIFQAFERERTSTVSGIQGTGLGTAITKNIVELMSGTIDVITEKDVGTEFIVRVHFDIIDNPTISEPTQIDEPSLTDFSGVKNTPIIAMTANAMPEDIKRTHKAGMNDHISKPLDVPKMLATISRILKSNRGGVIEKN